jgi:[ribosomal protein S18]-alanine N-acetyltransferase
MEFSLRPPAPADFEMVASWISDARACSRWAGPLVPFPFPIAELPTLIHATDTNTFCLSMEEHDLLGFAQYFAKGNGVVRLARVIVSPSYRGQGLGKILCALVMEKALKSLTVESFSLGVYRDNPAAITIYSRLGFSVVEDQSTEEHLTMALQADHSFQGTALISNVGPLSP